ncbi:MAG: selenocysteine-specific translation elongation factor [Spirochaetes bacterium]|nr:selenocysteine-specific translation elongation factor [Spirochaetota bacterium]
MYVVGTAGHIDHGKTSLIKALTGIDCDRLPEEKAREMTIDIGFAKIDYPKFGAVSIIDVPGHERFIRNMVVGAWGVDIGLLVVAVDDGWMPQTDDHFKVLDLLGVQRIIVVLNKIDIADEETIALAEADVREHLSGTRFADCDIVKVSAKTGEGIENLKETILKNLRILPKVHNAEKPYLFVDRVFSAKGYGTVVTGTLKNGTFRENDEITILPQKIKTRIKKIESHYAELQEGIPSQRIALNVSGMAKEDLRRGCIVVLKNFFSETNTIAAMMNFKNVTLKNNTRIYIIIGTETLPCRLIFLPSTDINSKSFPAILRFDHNWFFYPSEPFIVTRPGGFRIIGGGKVLLPLTPYLQKQKHLLLKIKTISDTSLESLISLAINMHNAIEVNAILESFPHPNSTIEKIINSLEAKGMVKLISNYALSMEFYESSIAKIFASINSAIGINTAELASRTNIPVEHLKLLIPKAIEKHSIIEKDGRYFAGNAITEETLPIEKKQLLAYLKKAGKEGIELSKLNDDRKIVQLKELIRLGFAISLEGGLVYHCAVYEELKQQIMQLFENKEKISISEVRDVTGLSRKYLIPLLNKIESEGLVKRVGDYRIKL